MRRLDCKIPCLLFVLALARAAGASAQAPPDDPEEAGELSGTPDAGAEAPDAGTETPDAAPADADEAGGAGLDPEAEPPAEPPAEPTAEAEPEQAKVARADKPLDRRSITDRTPSDVVIRTLLALLGMLVLAYLAGHPRVQRLEERLGISQVIAAGLPFFALGAIAHHPRVDLLSDALLADLTPLLEFGLGWIGLFAGMQFDVRATDQWPRGTANLTAVLTFVPFLVISGAAGVILYALLGSTDTYALLRDAAAFGAAGCLAAPTASTLLAATLSERAAHVVRSVAVVDDVGGVVLLALLSAFYRPSGGHIAWELPGVGWLLVLLGLGLGLGGLAYAVLRVAANPREVTVVLVGGIAFAAGSATFFSLSPIVICFLAGLVIANLPGRHHDIMKAPLARLERPIYLMFLLIAGALWRFDAWEGWILLMAFVAARLLGRALAAKIAHLRGMLHEAPGEEAEVSRAFVLAPVGALSIAIVVNLKTLYPGETVPIMVTAVVGGALFSELHVQVSSRYLARGRRSTPAPPSVVSTASEESAP
ncbi:MAG: cation:proton antiporter [Sandaracinaceae bacterium]|nr:cation:proton antiporter [Sandaracinaceae bacterium]